MLSSALRGVAALLLLSAALVAQSFTVTFGEYSATASAPAYAKLLDEDGNWRCSVHVQDGELVITNGAVEVFHGSVTDQLTIQREGSTVFSEQVTIHDGCGFVYRDTAVGWSPPNRAAAHWLSWYFAGGAADPDLEVCREWDWGGPNPDPSDAGATGSGRVAWSRWPLGMAMQHLLAAGEDPTAEQWAEAYRWGAQAPWDRAQNYEHGEPGIESWTPTEQQPVGPAGRRWRALDNPDAVVGWGYRNAGGFSNIYGRTELYGRVDSSGKPVRSKGKNWVDRQHGDQAGTVWVAAATGSWAARRAAYNYLETVASQNAASGMHFPNSRSVGWPVRSFALVYMLEHDPSLLPYIDAMDDRIRELRGFYDSPKGPRFFLTEHKPLGGHLDDTPAFHALLDDLGFDGDREALLEWDSSWMASIAGLSFLFMADATAGTARAEMAGGLLGGQDRAASWKEHARWAAAVVFVTGTAGGYNVETMAPSKPGWEGLRLSNARSSRSNIWSDTRKGGKGEHNWVVGVGAGTVLPFGEEFARRFPGKAHVVLPVSNAIAERCYSIAWWDAKTPDRFLLDRAHTWAGRRGWKGKSWRPVAPEDN